MPWRKHNKLTLNAPAGIGAAALAVASCFIFFMNRLFYVCLSGICPIPWFLTEGEEVLVDPSTWTNLNTFEPGTNNRECLSSLMVLQSYVRILLFGHHLVLLKKKRKTSAVGTPMGGWNSTLQAAWYVRHAHWACLCYAPFVILLCLWIISTIWLSILSSTNFMVGRSRVFYIYSSWKIYVGDSPGCYVNRTILQGRCCPWPFCARILYNPHRGRGVRKPWYGYILNRIKPNWEKLPST